MRIGWLPGWAVPPAWFLERAKTAFPEAEHEAFAAGPDAVSQLTASGPFDWIGGYSLGTLLLLRDPARIRGTCERVALLAPIFAFPREAGLGGRIARAEVRRLACAVALDPAAALAGFYERAGLEELRGHVLTSDKLVRSQHMTPSSLLWGLEQLENVQVEPRLPEGWRGWCGASDALLAAELLRAAVPEVVIVPGVNHHPDGLLRAFAAAAEIGAQG
jgi:hypothetical protein